MLSPFDLSGRQAGRFRAALPRSQVPAILKASPERRPAGTITLSIPSIAVLFALGVTAHKLEEALWLAPWARSHLRLPFRPSRRIYAVLTSLVSLAVWISVLAVCLCPRCRPAQIALAGFAVAMAVNALLPHLLLSLARRSLSPGTLTGLLLNLPLGIALLRAQLSAGVLTAGDLVSSSLLFALLFGLTAVAAVLAAHRLGARPGPPPLN